MFDFITNVEDVQLALIICGTAVALIFIIFQPVASRTVRMYRDENERLSEKIAELEGALAAEHQAYLDAAFGENRVTRIPVERYSYDYDTREWTKTEDIRR